MANSGSNVVSKLPFIIAMSLLPPVFLLGFLGLGMEFYGPWAGLGAHQDPPPLPVFIVSLIGFFIFSIAATVAFLHRQNSTHTVFASLAKGLPWILLGLQLGFYQVLVVLQKLGLHTMIVDQKGPFGEPMGESMITHGFASELVCFLQLPVAILALSGTSGLISATRRKIEVIHVVTLILSLLWFLYWFFITAEKRYLY